MWLWTRGMILFRPDAPALAPEIRQILTFEFVLNKAQVLTWKVGVFVLIYYRLHAGICVMFVLFCVCFVLLTCCNFLTAPILLQLSDHTPLFSVTEREFL